MTSGVSCDLLAEPQQQQQQQSQQQSKAEQVSNIEEEQQQQQQQQAVLIGNRQYRSESQDSGQLSLISSFGSISINHIVNQQHPRYQQRKVSESSQDFLPPNYVDYHQYCSLMLLNSFDCCEEDIKNDYHHQPYSFRESLKSLPGGRPESLCERRTRWFAGLEKHLQEANGLVGVHRCDQIEQQEATLASTYKEVSEIKNAKIEAEGERDNRGKSKKGGNRFVAALAATQTSLMDKLWTHVVKRTGTPSQNNSAKPIQKQQVMPTKSTQQSAGSGINLLSDLSRRLVRRCGVGGGIGAKAKHAHSMSETALESSSLRAAMSAVGGDHNRQATAAATAAVPLVVPSEQQKHCVLAAGPTSASCQHLGEATNLLNASSSTLNTTTTPSGCCNCDTETCSSSGFVSSLATTTTPAPIANLDYRPVGGHTISLSSATVATSNCFNDTIANNSCNCSTYNDHHLSRFVASPTLDHDFTTSITVGELKLNDHTTDNSGNTIVIQQTDPAVKSSMAASLASSAPHHQRPGEPTATIIEVLDGQEPRERHQKLEAHSADPKEPPKSKGSLLNRARNSTINLASLAPIANRFNGSASVGNLWNQNAGNQAHSPKHANSELMTPEHDNVQTLDYVPCKTFDDVKIEPEVSEAKCNKSHSNNKISSGNTSSRKLSAKEKCRRQKDAERVEKLRLLVNYLRSGSSQPVVSPVALEADEIELAERYKLQMAFRENLLALNDDANTQALPESQFDKGSVEQSSVAPTSSSISACQPHSTAIVTNTSNTSPSTSSFSMNHPRGAGAVVNYGSVCSNRHNITGHARINKSTAPTISATRSIPHIGHVSWVLRHSISDPGNKFGHNFNCNTANYSTSGAQSSTASAFSRDLQVPTGQFNPQMAALSVGQVVHQSPSSDSHNEANSCKNNDGLCNLCNITDRNINNNSSSSSSIIHQSTRLFYIDDLDAPHIQPSPIGQKSSPSSPRPLNKLMMSTPNPNGDESMASMMTQAASSGNFTSSICSSSTSHAPIKLATSSGETTSKSCRVWTNPQNLATWIDNEVNSLVHDLEINESRHKLSHDSHKNHHPSQKLPADNNKTHQSSQKHNASKAIDKSSSNICSGKSKDGKRKWLSVTTSNTRRSSSGAQST